MNKGKVEDRWCSCDEGAKLDGRECVVRPRMVDGGENAALLSGGVMIKKGGATGPNSQQYILAFASQGYARFFTIWHQVTVRISWTRGCSRLVGAATDPPRVMEGVVEKGEVLIWRLRRALEGLVVFVGPHHCSEK